MMFWMIGAGLGVLAILFRLATLTRLTLPLLYTLSMLTVFHSWYQTHTALADDILFVLVGLVVLSWLLSLLGRVWSFIQERQDDRAAVEYFKYLVRKAKENGEDTISTEGLWR
ncbi:MAG: hypothetical protein EGQ09_14020 [Clostridiales bacterium]|nr:hypothetical protein [Clostridiales bacterium]